MASLGPLLLETLDGIKNTSWIAQTESNLYRCTRHVTLSVLSLSDPQTGVLGSR